MILILVLFLLTMTLTAGTYLLVNRSLLNRETAKVRNRLTDSAPRAASAGTSTSPSLFLPDSKEKDHLLGRLLQKFNLDQGMQELIEQAGLGWATGQACMGSLLLALAAFNVIWYLTPLGHLFSAGGAALAGALPILYIRRARKRRLAAFEAQFLDSLQFIARAMRAGHAFPVSLEMVHHEFDDPLGAEFRRTFEEQNLGLPVDTALQKLSVRLPLMDVQFFVAAVLLQKRTGGNLAEILDKLASLIRERFKLRGQIRTISAHGRLSSLVLTAIPMAVAVMMYMVHPEHMKFFVDNEMGQWMAGLALGLQVLGYFVMRQIVKIEV